MTWWGEMGLKCSLLSVNLQALTKKKQKQLIANDNRDAFPSLLSNRLTQIRVSKSGTYPGVLQY